MRFVAIVEARMTSSRLPGKVLLPALGKPMLHHLLQRLRAVESIDEIVIATTVNAADDALISFAAHEGVRVFRGSELDVMARLIGAAEFAKADVIVEITGDCPIIDPDIVEQTIRMFKAHSADYVGNGLVRSYPDGMDTQVFRLEALKRSAAMTSDPLDREHVSLHMCNHPELFSQVKLVAPPSLHWPELGLTLDEADDYQLLKNLIEHFGVENPLFSCGDIICALKENPQWLEINRNVKRKGNT
jgi:spore coat polysaccharide biosynthesis protein SpsF